MTTVIGIVVLVAFICLGLYLSDKSSERRTERLRHEDALRRRNEAER